MKRPYLPLYTGDWMKDPCLLKCSPLTRGIWIDALCCMHEDHQSGLITGTPENLARSCRCTLLELDTALKELKDSQTATVTVRHKNVTIVNRRMKRESDKRKSDRIRQVRKRQKDRENDVT